MQTEVPHTQQVNDDEPPTEGYASGSVSSIADVQASQCRIFCNVMQDASNGSEAPNCLHRPTTPPGSKRSHISYSGSLPYVQVRLHVDPDTQTVSVSCHVWPVVADSRGCKSSLQHAGSRLSGYWGVSGRMNSEYSGDWSQTAAHHPLSFAPGPWFG